jgi:hypothetical protein
MLVVGGRCGWTRNAVSDERSPLQGENATLKKEPLAAAVTRRAKSRPPQTGTQDAQHAEVGK